ncbi:MAG: pyruvate kinase [Candidatus Pacebacteria bacterium]|nr:pyruvate kinase [Candidatus Paceibacterota bacterium]
MTPPQKSTKIVVTIGPATETEEVIEQLILAGMNVARFNTKHGTPEWHHDRIMRVKAVAQRLNTPVAILIDLQGPEIRIQTPGEQPVEIVEDEHITFSVTQSGDEKTIIIPQEVIDAEQEGNTLIIDDGLGEFVIVGKESDALIVEAKNTCSIGHRKSLNTPGVVINMPPLVAQDYVHLDAATNDIVEFVGLSFVRNAQDVHNLREELKKRNLDADVVAKIENQAALDNLDEIVKAADVVMIARGDLGVEVPYEELTHWQKTIVTLCREQAKPVITATQMLKSMVNFPYPSRAEVSDVANAVYDGTDAVMLSDETTIGKYPVKAVAAQAKIVAYNEQFAKPPAILSPDIDVSHWVTHAASMLLKTSSDPSKSLVINRVVCFSETGATAKQLMRFRQIREIDVVTDSQLTYNQLSIVYGVRPWMMSLENENLSNTDSVVSQLTNLGIVKSGEVVLLIHGSHWKQPGLTNVLKIVTIP